MRCVCTCESTCVPVHAFECMHGCVLLCIAVAYALMAVAMRMCAQVFFLVATRPIKHFKVHFGTTQLDVADHPV